MRRRHCVFSHDDVPNFAKTELYVLTDRKVNRHYGLNTEKDERRVSREHEWCEIQNCEHFYISRCFDVQHTTRTANSVWHIIVRGDGSPVSKHMVVENNTTVEGATRKTAVPAVRAALGRYKKTKFDDDATVINK